MAATDATGAELTARKRERNEAHSFFLSFSLATIKCTKFLNCRKCGFMGSGATVNTLRKTWRRNNKRWMQDKPFPETLVSLVETQLPRSPDFPGGYQQVECGIHYGQFLPIDGEHGAKSGSDTEYLCENTNCSGALHSMCLVGLVAFYYDN